MIDPALSRKWLYWTLFLVLSGVIFFLRLIPLQTTPSNWAMPDLLVCMCFAWVLRRPDYTPVFLVAAVMLLADMLFQRPPGLMAALVVIGTEFMRRRTHLMRALPFLLEWAMVAGVMFAMFIAYRLVLTVVMQPLPSFWLSLTLLISTTVAYPLVVAFSRYVLGVRKFAPGEVDELGHQI